MVAIRLNKQMLSWSRGFSICFSYYRRFDLVCSLFVFCSVPVLYQCLSLCLSFYVRLSCSAPPVLTLLLCADVFLYQVLLSQFYFATVFSCVEVPHVFPLLSSPLANTSPQSSFVFCCVTPIAVSSSSV